MPAHDVKSRTAGGILTASQLAPMHEQALLTTPQKFFWFWQRGYHPHLFQTLFHGAQGSRGLKRFRHLVAGRRGGKTLSAAWEVLFYCLFPAQFHMDAHGEEKDTPLWVWLLAKDHKLGRPSQMTFLKVLQDAGLVAGVDYRYHKTEKTVTFTNGSFVEFRSAEDPQSLRGAGINILWIDEAAMIPSEEAWNVSRPALSETLGLVITTTTPKGKNWFYEYFWGDSALSDEHQFRVEYTSIDNPYFPTDEWDYARRTMHPVVFAQEYLASFDAMAGIELHGDWLHYYVRGDIDHPDDVKLPPADPLSGQLPLRVFMAVDPASSLADTADHFGIVVMGLDENTAQAYLLETWKGRIEFPAQLDKIAEFNLRWRPEVIGVEANAYQRVLMQQAWRLEGMPNVIPVFAKGKKSERIMAASPLYRSGRVRIMRSQMDFIEEWINYDSTLKNPKDDLLDAAEVCIGLMGALLPRLPSETILDSLRLNPPPGFLSVQEEAALQVKQLRDTDPDEVYDEILGIDW